MKQSPFELALLLIKLQNVIGASLKCVGLTSEVRSNLISLSIGLSQVSFLALDFEGEPTEGVEK